VAHNILSHGTHVRGLRAVGGEGDFEGEKTNNRRSVALTVSYSWGEGRSEVMSVVEWGII
jgi:hypothetical protein